jgi:hypothetical protein
LSRVRVIFLEPYSIAMTAEEARLGMGFRENMSWEIGSWTLVPFTILFNINIRVYFV